MDEDKFWGRINSFINIESFICDRMADLKPENYTVGKMSFNGKKLTIHLHLESDLGIRRIVEVLVPEVFVGSPHMADPGST